MGTAPDPQGRLTVRLVWINDQARIWCQQIPADLNRSAYGVARLEEMRPELGELTPSD